MEIAAGIHWVDRVIANVYLIIEPSGVTLIDTGLRSLDRVDLIFNYLERLKKYPIDVKRILITHADIDHIGNLKGIYDETRAAILAGPQTRELIASSKQPQHLPGPIQWVINRLIKLEPIAADQIRAFDQSNRTLPILGGLEVISTPGHTAEHFSFYHRQSGVLFAGDALLMMGGRLSSSYKIHSVDYDLAKKSALKLLKLNPTVIATGHGKPLMGHSALDLHQFSQKLASA